MLRSKVIVAEQTTSTLQEILSSSDSRITELEILVHKLEQYSHKVEIAGILRDIPHVILEDVAILWLVTDLQIPTRL